MCTVFPVKCIVFTCLSDFLFVSVQLRAQRSPAHFQHDKMLKIKAKYVAFQSVLKV